MDFTFLPEIAAALVVCVLAAAAFLTVQKAMKMPVPRSDDLKMWIVIGAERDGDKLEQAVKSVLWLNESGALNCCTAIADMGLEPEARRMAELMSKNGDCVLCGVSELPDILEGTK